MAEGCKVVLNLDSESEEGEGSGLTTEKPVLSLLLWSRSFSCVELDVLSGSICGVFMTVDADDSEHSEVDLITLSTEVVDGEAEIVVNSSEAFSAINTSRSALSCVAIA